MAQVRYRLTAMDGPIWTPSPGRVRATRLKRFMDEAGQSDYATLHRWSVERRREFWSALWDIGEIIAHRGPDRVVDSDKLNGRAYEGLVIVAHAPRMKHRLSITPVISSGDPRERMR